MNSTSARSHGFPPVARSAPAATSPRSSPVETTEVPKSRWASKAIPRIEGDRNRFPSSE